MKHRWLAPASERPGHGRNPALPVFGGRADLTGQIQPPAPFQPRIQTPASHPPLAPDSWARAADGNWATAANWTAGVPGASSTATISASGHYTVTVDSHDTAYSLALNSSTATLSLASGGTLSLSGSLSVTAGTLSVGLGSEIAGGTLSVASPGAFQANGGTLKGVSCLGTLNVGSYLIMESGFTGASTGGPAVINLGYTGELVLAGGQTLSNVTINIDAYSSGLVDNAVAGQTLTFGQNCIVIDSQFEASPLVFDFGNGSSGGNTLVNQGAIALASSERMSIEDSTGPGVFINQGYLLVADDSALTIDVNMTTGQLGHFITAGIGAVVLRAAESLNNTGATLTLGATSELALMGTISGGTLYSTSTLAEQDGGLVADSGTLSNLTVVGDLILDPRTAGFQLSTNGDLTFNNVTIDGAVYSDAGAVVRNGLNVSGGSCNYTMYSGASLGFADTQTINNLTLEVAGTDHLNFGDDTGTAQTLTLGANCQISIDGSPDTTLFDISTSHGGSQTYGETLLNLGVIDVGSASNPKTSFSIYDNGSSTFTNLGTLDVANGSTIYILTAYCGNLSGATLAGGTFEVDGKSTIEFGMDNAITVDAATLILNGAGAVIETARGAIDATLGTIASAGTLELAGGRNFTTAGAFVDNGSLLVIKSTFTDAYGLAVNGGLLLAGATVAATGGLNIDAIATVGGFGTISGAINDAGTVDAGGGTLILTGAVSGAGLLEANAGAELDIMGGGTFAGTVGGAGTVHIGADLTLGSGAVFSATEIVVNSGLALAANAALTLSSGSLMDFDAAAKTTVGFTGPSLARYVNDGTFAADGAGTAQVKVSVINNGDISVASGKLEFLGGVTNNGVIDQQSGVLSISRSLTGSGTLDVAATGHVALASVGEGETVAFTAGQGLLDMTAPLEFFGQITSFGGADRIDLLKTQETGFSFANGTLSVFNGAATVANLAFGPGYTQSDFSLGSDGKTGTLIKFI